MIIATGGFGANVKLRQEVNTGVFKDYDLGKSIGCTNFQKSAQGSGILMGKEVGANVIGMADIQVHPFFQNCRISPAAPIRAPKPLCTTHERTNE